MKKILFASTLLLLVSCADFLNLENPNKQTSQSFWHTPEQLESGVASIYNALTEEPAGYWEIQAQQMKECRTENFSSRNDVQARFAVSTFRNTPSTTISDQIFRSLYVGIFRANQVIHYADQVKNIDEQTKNDLLAEAKFLRALNYFHVAIEFGEAPLVTKLISDKADYFTSKSTQAEIWSQVVLDLEAAKKDLPIERPSKQTGRATRGAAIAYLGKAYLYQGLFEKAESEFKTIVDNQASYPYGLLEDYASLFDGKNENSKESVFEIQFSLYGGPDIWTSNQSKRTRATTMAQECAPGEVGGWFELIATPVLLQALLKEKTKDDAFDPRALATLAWNYPDCKYYTYDFAEKFGENAIWIRKNQNWWNKDEGDWKSTLNEYAMRYADVLLMLAESYTMQNKVSLAAPLVQRIRERAKLKDIADAMNGWSQEQMMIEIMHQRNVEFAREGLHFYDLRRWNTLEQVIKDSKVEGYNNYAPRYQYFPIPEQELNNNVNMTQNDAWN
ncbi:membrane protein [Bacteroidales bacterium]|nr:membrane protein [Bacteroidales bacterium]